MKLAVENLEYLREKVTISEYMKLIIKDKIAEKTNRVYVEIYKMYQKFYRQSL